MAQRRVPNITDLRASHPEKTVLGRGSADIFLGEAMLHLQRGRAVRR